MADASDEGPLEPSWLQLELAWPLSLLSGFAGAWAGLASRVPGLASTLALLAFLPLHWRLSRRAERRRAVLCALGWLIGISAAVLGAALDGDLALGALPGVHAWTDHLRERAAGLSLASPEREAQWLAAPALLFGLALISARWTRGVGALTVAGWAAASIAGATGMSAADASGAAGVSLSALAAAYPPDFAFDLAGLAVAGAALASPLPSAAGRRWSGARGWAALATAAALAALLLRAVGADAWGAWSAGQLGAG